MNKIVLKTFFAFIAISVFSSQAVAQQIVFAPSFFYQSNDDSFEGADGESTETFYDIKLGVTLSNNLYVGAIYASDTLDSGSSENTRTSYGASVGYMQPTGWFIIGHYFISSEFEIGSTTTWQEGSGFGADFGYMFELGSGFLLGPQISYKTWEYSELDSSGTTTDLDDTSSTDLLPMVNIAVKF